MPPRATSNTAKSTRGFCSTIRADFGPLASDRITSRSSITMPSVEVMPTLRPIPLKTCAIIRDVVVLPLVPVTATIGIRLGRPAGNSESSTGLATNCASPTVGWVCIRNPGAALTSQMAPPVSRTGSAMSGEMKSMPATSRPTTRAASSAISTLSGCASRVRSIEMPPVDMFPVSVSFTWTPSGGTSVMREALLADQLDRGVVHLDPGQHLLVADAAARVGVGLVDQLAHGADAVADDVRRHPLGQGDHPPADDEDPVVLAGDERLDHDPAAPGLLLRGGERGADVVGVLQVEHHAAAVVAVQRLAHDGVADPVGDLARPARPCAPTPTAAPAGRRRRAGGS